MRYKVNMFFSHTKFFGTFFKKNAQKLICHNYHPNDIGEITLNR